MRRLPGFLLWPLLLAIGAAWYRLPAFSGAMQAASPPALTDADGDGIPDEWEVNGVDITLPGGASRHLDLKQMGASPTHKDVFVWIAWMEQGNYTHKPRRNRDGLETYALERVVKAFQSAPVPNPDGTKGINVHLIYADAPVRHVNLLGDSDNNGNYNWTAFQQIKDRSFPTAPASLAGVFHYVLFAHQISLPDQSGDNCTSGISRDMPSHDFIVSLGCVEDDAAKNPADQGDSEWQSGTFMHELGHNLGLRHGGADDINYKPNYISVMNYLFQFSGIFRDGVQGQFDYSQFNVALDENHLIPQKGISSNPGLKRYGSAHVCGSQGQAPVPMVSLGDPVRWDCRDQPPESTEISFDVNLDGCVQVLQGQEDWSRIALTGPGSASTSTCVPSSASLGREADARISALAPIVPVHDVQTAVTADGILVQWDRIPLDSVRGYEVFRQVPGGQVSRLTQTRKNTFLDDSAQPGVRYSYRVGAVVVLPNLAVLDWFIREQAKAESVVARLATAVGRARFGLPVNLLPGQTDLSFRTARSAPVVAIRPMGR